MPSKLSLRPLYGESIFWKDWYSSLKRMWPEFLNSNYSYFKLKFEDERVFSESGNGRHWLPLVESRRFYNLHCSWKKLYCTTSGGTIDFVFHTDSNLCRKTLGKQEYWCFCDSHFWKNWVLIPEMYQIHERQLGEKKDFKKLHNLEVCNVTSDNISQASNEDKNTHIHKNLYCSIIY